MSRGKPLSGRRWIGGVLWWRETVSKSRTTNNWRSVQTMVVSRGKPLPSIRRRGSFDHIGLVPNTGNAAADVVGDSRHGGTSSCSSDDECHQPKS